MILFKNRMLSARLMRISALLLILIFLGSSCSRNGEPEEDEIKGQNDKELLIYCGITMIRPMARIAAMIEEQENCKITITKGGSGNLLKSIVHNKTGDLYLPGSDRYYKMIDEKYPGLVTQTKFVGYNTTATIF